MLQQLAGTRPTVQALLQNLPAGAANGQTKTIVVNGVTGIVPLGSVTGAGGQRFNDWQYSYRVDHRFNSKHALTGRYMEDQSESGGTGQLTPSGLSNIVPSKTQSVTVNFTSSFSPTTFNEARISYSRYYDQHQRRGSGGGGAHSLDRSERTAGWPVSTRPPAVQRSDWR